MLKSKQTHARLVHLFLCHVLNAVHLCTTVFELAQGFTHPVHIDERSEAQFKFGIHLGCKKKWPTGGSDHQSALETNNWPMRTFCYWGRGDGKEGSGGRGGGASGGAISLQGGR